MTTSARREAPLWARPVFGTVGGCTDHRETRVIADGCVLAHVVMRHYGACATRSQSLGSHAPLRGAKPRVRWWPGAMAAEVIGHYDTHHPVGAADSKGLASRRTAARSAAPLWARPVFGTVGGCTDHRETRVIADGRALAHVRRAASPLGVMRHYGACATRTNTGIFHLWIAFSERICYTANTEAHTDNYVRRNEHGLYHH